MTREHHHDHDRTSPRPSEADDGPGAGKLSRSAALVAPTRPLISRLASSGSPLPGALARKFEGSLGADLSAVRVHTGDDSQQAASSFGAKAYAIGPDIHFAAGQFDPGSAAGEHLLAHEVAHTVQQTGQLGRRVQPKLAVSSPADDHEIEADRAADAMVTGSGFSLASTGGAAIARKAELPVVGKGMSVDLVHHDFPPRHFGPLELGGKLGVVLDCEPHATEPTEGASPAEIKAGVGAKDASLEISKKLAVQGEPTLSANVTLSDKGFSVEFGVSIELGTAQDIHGFTLTAPEAKLLAFTYEDGAFHLLGVDLSQSLTKSLGTIAGYDVTAIGTFSLVAELDAATIVKEAIGALGVEGALFLSGVAAIAGSMLAMWATCTDDIDRAHAIGYALYDYVNGYSAGIRQTPPGARLPPIGPNKNDVVRGDIAGLDALTRKAADLHMPLLDLAKVMRDDDSTRGPSLFAAAWPNIKAQAIAQWNADWTHTSAQDFTRILQAMSYYSVATHGQPEIGEPTGPIGL